MRVFFISNMMADEFDNSAPIEQPVDNPQDDTPPVVVDELVDAPADDVPTDTPEDAPADSEPNDEPASPEEEGAVEIPVFDPTAEDFEAKVTETISKYDLEADAPDLHALITALQSNKPTDIVSEYADYGDRDALTAALERESHLSTQREEKPGVYRPNTDKFVESLPEETADHLFFDLSRTPSLKYRGITKLEENLADALAVEGDTVGSVLKRVRETVAMVRNNAIVPPSDVPSFIPPNLVPAFKTRSLAKRTALAELDPDYNSDTIADELRDLADIQKGIDGEIREQQLAQEAVQQKQEAFSRDVDTIVTTFTNEFRETFTQNLIKNVKFSDDPQRQNWEARKQVIALELAFAPDATGEYARAALKEAGIDFDNAKAAALLKNVNNAAVDLAKAKSEVDNEGRQLNPIALNKAKSAFLKIGREWQDFAQKILDQQSKVSIEGKKADVKDEVAKIKIMPKGRSSVKNTPSPVKRDENKMPAHITMFSPEYYEWQADRQLAEQARKAAMYQ